MGETSRIGALTWSAFLVVVLVGGGNFVAVRVSNQELAPFWGAGLRFGLAAVIFVMIALALRLTWPRGRALRLAAVYGILSFTLSYALMYWALTHVSAGVASVLLASVPLITQFLAAAHRMERLSRRNLTGAVIALSGIVVMTVGPSGLAVPLGGLIAIAIAAFTVGESVIVGKKVSVGHPAMTNAVGMPIGAMGLLIISAVAGERWALPQQTDVRWSVLYLALIGSVGLFVLLLLVIRRWTASATSYAFVLFPVVSLLLEAWILDEPLTGRSVGGAAIVMAGVWYGALAQSARLAGRLGLQDPQEKRLRRSEA
jgi:drug/metabolite transporter (DMT)-like permease